MTIAENLLQLNEAKQAIKTAIESKGQDLTGVPFTGYAEKITAISGGSSIGIITKGEFTPTDSNTGIGQIVIDHGLGVEPDIVFFIMNDDSIAELGNEISYTVGGSQINLGRPVRGGGNQSNRYIEVITQTAGEDFFAVNYRSASASGATIFSNTQFSVWYYGGATFKIQAGATYTWYAIKLS